MTPTPIPLLPDLRCQLGEGPVWDAQRGLLCWVDILTGNIHQYDPAQQTRTSIHVPHLIGAVALCGQPDRFVAVTEAGFCFIDRQSGAVMLLHNPEPDRPGNRFNDGKCDPAGRFWAGTMSLTDEPERGSLYTLNTDLSVTRQLAGVSIANGLAWSLDGGTLYFIDSPTRSVRAYVVDPQTGNLGSDKTILSIPAREGFPDGMTIDADGMLWIAHWDGWQVIRWHPETGDILRRIPLPVAQVTSCIFGGPHLTDLYITTARTGLSEADLREQPLAGSLFVLPDCGVSGLPAIGFVM
jgi:sugar lactone lactonase YvrE